MRRIASAAAKKWPRLSQCCACSPSTKPQVGFVNEGRCFECLSGLFLGQPLRGQAAQLVVDQRQELLRGNGVALFDGREDTRDVGHSGSLPREERLVSPDKK
jgi:hypothetical protein